ncbi:MAG: hypothetical protein ACOC15_01060 [Desulfovibrionales bacterium]
MDPSHLFKISVQERQEELFSGLYRRVQRRDSEVKDQRDDREPSWQRDFLSRQGQRTVPRGQSAEAMPKAVLYNAKGRIVSFDQRS